MEKNLEKISKHEITPYRALCEEFGVTFLLTMYSLSFYIIFSYFPLFYNKKQFSSASKQWDNKVVSDFERFPANFVELKNFIAVGGLGKIFIITLRLWTELDQKREIIVNIS